MNDENFVLLYVLLNTLLYISNSQAATEIPNSMTKVVSVISDTHISRIYWDKLVSKTTFTLFPEAALQCQG